MRGRSFRAEREFGFVVGGILTLLSGWWLYRGRFGTVPEFLLPIGTLLICLAVVWPRLLILPNRAWMGIAEGLSFVTTRIILAFVFFLLLTPIALIKRARGWDPLRRRASGSGSYWYPYPQRSSRHYEKMY